MVAARPRLASCSLYEARGLRSFPPYLTLPYLTLPSEGASVTANGCRRVRMRQSAEEVQTQAEQPVKNRACFEILILCGCRCSFCICSFTKVRYPFEYTVSRGLRETVSYRNRAFVFPDFGIETVRAPPPRATETTVSVKKNAQKRTHTKKTKKKRAAACETDRNGACPPESCFLLARV